MNGLGNIAVLIPAWMPEPKLLELVAALRAFSFAVVLVVEDGSTSVSAPIFHALRETGTPVVRHAVNLGKGRALKSGFNAILTDYPAVDGVVTADADGQHRPEDILRVARALASNPSCAVLGTRTFTGAVPLRSRLGNSLTRLLFRYATGTSLRDTQTGLRGLPVSLLPALMKLEGERYEYEMNMLVHLCRGGLRPVEAPIETVYLEGNRSSHFRPIADSVRIYSVLARLSH